MASKILSFLVSFAVAGLLLAGGSYATFGVVLTWAMIVLGVLCVVGILADGVKRPVLERMGTWPVRVRALLSDGAHVAALVYTGYPITGAVLTIVLLTMFTFAAQSLQDMKEKANV